MFHSVSGTTAGSSLRGIYPDAFEQKHTHTHTHDPQG